MPDLYNVQFGETRLSFFSIRTGEFMGNSGRYVVSGAATPE